jgi:hypothetical protein
MTPFFNPGPIAHPRIPIHIAGVQRFMCRLAGELCDGFQVHPFHSVKYLREVVLPNIEEGLRASGRKREDIRLASSVFIVTGRTSDEMDAARRGVKSQIGFYASTPNYRVILDCHGWGQVARELTRRSIQGDWEGMAALVTDEMLDAFALVGAPHEVPEKLRRRYTGLLDRLAVYETFQPEGDLTAQRALLAAFLIPRLQPSVRTRLHPGNPSSPAPPWHPCCSAISPNPCLYGVHRRLGEGRRWDSRIRHMAQMAVGVALPLSVRADKHRGAFRSRLTWLPGTDSACH